MRNKRTRAERADETAERLLEVATQLFAQHGYAAVSVGDLCKKARVTTGALYHHFKDKPGLFRRVAERVTARLVADAAATADRHQDPWDRLCAGIDAVLAASSTAEVKIAFLEAPVVLGLSAWRKLEEQHTAPLLIRSIGDLVAAKKLAPDRAQALGVTLRGMLVEAAMAIAEAKDPEPVRLQLGAMIRTMVMSLAA